MEETVTNVLKTLEEKGFESYIVGGYVRDYLMGITSLDIDIATLARPKDVMNLFSNNNPVSSEYGNVSFEKDDYTFDITTFRKDIKYTGNRKPEKIVYIDSFKEDLERRDFTINSIAMDSSGKIIDIYNGKADIKKKIIKSVLDPDKKIQEDSLRILRAIRFATIFRFKLDNDLKKAIIKHKDLLKKLSYERKREELNKIFTSKHKKYGVKLLTDLDLLEVLELKDLKYVFRTNDIIGMWSVITDQDYAFTKYEKEIMEKVKALIKENLHDKYIQYKYGGYALTLASDLKKNSTKRITQSYDKLPIKGREELDISAEEICEVLGRDPDSFLKTIFDDLEKLVVSGKIKNKKEKIENYIRQSY